MLSGKIIEFEAGRSSSEPVQVNSVGLPAVPVMPQTLLLLDLCAQRRSAELNEIAQVVLGDPGATIQIMREASEECAFGDDRPCRIEDYISALGVEGCIEAASRKTVTRAMNKAAIIKTWSHSIEIAENCRRLARGGMSAGEAYLAGLLHELGSLPAILGWKADPEVLNDPVLAGLQLAEEWCFPRCVTEYFAETAQLSDVRFWSTLVWRAHERSNVLPAICSEVEDGDRYLAVASQR